jgi:cytochrome c556
MTEEEIYIPPYNYCDYRCERCEYANECLVYKKDRVRRVAHILRGEDPDDINTVLEDVGEEMEQAMEMIYEMAEEMGIDLDAEMDKDVEEEIFDPKDDPLYKLAYSFTLKTHDFLKNVEEKVLITPEIKTYFDELRWYHTLLSAKLYRALCSNGVKEVDNQDAKLSAGVALKSGQICQDSLESIIYYRQEIAKEVNKLLKMIKKVNKGIKERFF